VVSDRHGSPRTKIVAVWIGLLACALAGLARAQGAGLFVDHPSEMAGIFAMERMKVRLDALGALAGVKGKAAISPESAAAYASAAVQNVASEDLPLVQASLAKLDPNLSTSLRTSLQALSDASGIAGIAQAARQTAALAQQAVGAMEWNAGQGPEVRAAVLALLLTAPAGVEDSYDAAVDDGSPLTTATAWAALMRVHAIWSTLAGLVDTQHRSDIEQALASLDRILPSVAPAQQPDGGRSNDVGNEATRIVGALESVARASLVPDRDLGSLAGSVQALAGQACTASGADAAQGFAVARFYYTGYLHSSASMLVPDDDATVSAALDGLQKDPGTAATCPSLLGALGKVTTALEG